MRVILLRYYGTSASKIKVNLNDKVPVGFGVWFFHARFFLIARGNFTI